MMFGANAVNRMNLTGSAPHFDGFPGSVGIEPTEITPPRGAGRVPRHAPVDLVQIASDTLDALARRNREIEDRARHLVEHFRQVADEARQEIDRLHADGWKMAARQADLQKEIAAREQHYLDVMARQEREIEQYRNAIAVLRGWILDLENELRRSLAGSAPHPRAPSVLDSWPGSAFEGAPWRTAHSMPLR